MHWFHLAIPVPDLDHADRFYVDVLGASRGRRSELAAIYDFFGHQLVLHRSDPGPRQLGIYPRHFGIVFAERAAWQAVIDRCLAHEVDFYQPPRTRHAASPTEHVTAFLADPGHNLLEFKHYAHPEAIFDPLPGAALGDV